MARVTDRGSWSFVKVGRILQYKEDGMELIVEILEDRSTDQAYQFLLHPISMMMGSQISLGTPQQVLLKKRYNENICTYEGGANVHLRERRRRTKML